MTINGTVIPFQLIVESIGKIIDPGHTEKINIMSKYIQKMNSNTTSCRN
jgi:hypothetical protein